MAAQSKNQNFTEGLKKLLGDLAQLGTLPDADLEFCTTLQQAVTARIRSGMDQGQQGQQPPPGGPPGAPPGGMPAGANPGGMGMSATGAGGGISMAGGQAGAPNMDEMARALGSSTTTG